MLLREPFCEKYPTVRLERYKFLQMTFSGRSPSTRYLVFLKRVNILTSFR